jgi:hypothetical protein
MRTRVHAEFNDENVRRADFNIAAIAAHAPPVT